jgi:hypothetical protein
LAALNKHEHVLAGSFQLSKVGVESDSADRRFVPANLSVRREIFPANNTAHIEFVFGYADGRDVTAVGTDAQTMV